MISFSIQNIRKLTGAPLGVLAIIYSLFCIVERQATTDSYEVFVLRMLTDHYLLIYCMTPIFLLSIFRSLEEDSECFIIRFRKFSRYFYTKWFAILIYAILFVLLQIVIVLLMGMGLPSDNAYPIKSPTENELIYYFANVFPTPVVATFSVCLYMMIGLGFVGVSLLTTFHFFSRKVVTVLILLAYGIMALSIKIPVLGSLPFITINRYIILHHNFGVENGVLSSVTGMIILLIIQVMLIRFTWYRNFTFTWKIRLRGLFIYYARALWTRRNSLLICGILAMLTIWKAMTGESLQDYMLLFFYGSEIGRFHLLTFLEQIIYYGTPLYLFAIFIENWCTDDRLQVYIRIRRKRRWLYSIISKGIVFHIIYICFTFAFLFILGVMTDKSWDTHTIHISQKIQFTIWPIFLCLKIIEFSVLFLLFFCLFIWIKHVTAAYLIVMSMHALNFIRNEIFSFNPAGLVTIARLQILEGSAGLSFMQAFIVLFIAFILLLGVISRSYKRYFD